MRDYNSLEAEYVSGDMSVRALAEKHGVPENTLRKYAAKNKWKHKRDIYNTNLVQKTVNILNNQDVEAEVDRLSSLKSSAGLLEQIISKKLSKVSKEDDITAYALLQLTTSLKELSSTVRNLYSIPTQAEAEAQRIASERLKLDQRKLDLEDNNDTNVTVVLGSAEEYAK